MAGRSTIVNKIRVFAPELGKDSQEIERIVARLKQLEFEGYQFEAAESSFELIVRKMLGRYHPFFELDHYRILGENGRDGSRNTGALIKVKVGDKAEITAAEGNGPVHALDSALRKALTVFYPSLRKVRLTDYKVRVMEPKDGTATHRPRPDPSPRTASASGRRSASPPTSSKPPGSPCAIPSSISLPWTKSESGKNKSGSGRKGRSRFMRQYEYANI